MEGGRLIGGRLIEIGLWKNLSEISNETWYAFETGGLRACFHAGLRACFQWWEETGI